VIIRQNDPAGPALLALAEEFARKAESEMAADR
jgi:hypothetical protein